MTASDKVKDTVADSAEKDGFDSRYRSRIREFIRMERSYQSALYGLQQELSLRISMVEKDSRIKTAGIQEDLSREKAGAERDFESSLSALRKRREAEISTTKRETIDSKSKIRVMLYTASRAVERLHLCLEKVGLEGLLASIDFRRHLTLFPEPNTAGSIYGTDSALSGLREAINELDSWLQTRKSSPGFGPDLFKNDNPWKGG